MSAFLSVNCEECEHDSSWKDHFNEKVEQVLANISVVPGVAASSLVTNTLIGGDCFDIANITSTGNTNSRGTFSNGNTSIGIPAGAELCSGHVNITPGPNNSQNANNGFNTNSADDPDLATLTTGNQYDVSKIEFDFTPTANTVQFNFVFASEEYCEFVNTQYNDVFGFFISGPGISGVQNLAIIPNTTTPITINDVNHLSNTQYYVNNNTWNPCQGQPVQAINDCQFDGWTTVLTAVANVDSCETYHIKLAIADVADALYASAVFLAANSFNAGGNIKPESVYPAGQTYIYEDCGPGGFIRFTRVGGDVSQPFVVNYSISPNSTATWGVDYAALPNPIIIPAGATYIDIPITAFQDFIAEGDETIILNVGSSCSCSTSEVEFIIKDKPPLEVTLDDQTLCGGSSATLTPALSGGLSPFTYLWNTGSTATSITVNMNGTNTYTVTVTDKCGTTSTATATVTLQPQPTATLSGSGFFCEGQPGTVNLTINFTGTAPWELTYNAGGTTVTEIFNTTPAMIMATDPGAYNLISVTTVAGCPGTVSGNVNLTEYNVDVSLNPTNPACNGQSNGSVQAVPSGGGTPYTYMWNTGATSGTLSNLMPGTYNVTVSDSHGCTEIASVDLTEPPPITASATPTTNIDCYTPIGNADLTPEGGTPGYTYSWSNGSTQQDPDFSTGGTFTVTVTDSQGCTTTTTVTIASNITPPVAAANFTGQITCTNTSVTINGNGSSQGPEFTYEWSGPSFICCETTLNPQVDQGGTYTLTVTNGINGCTSTTSVTIPENTNPPVANINPPGQIGCNTPTLTLNGNGTTTGAGIVYTWSTLDGNFTCCTNTLNPQINQEGTYTLSVVNNNNGCTAETSVTIVGNTIPPDAVVAPPGTVTCYDPEITIDGTGSSTGSNFTYQWTTTNGMITGGGNTLNPTVNDGGTYTLVVTNTDNNCTATVTVVVPENNTPPVAVAMAIGGITCQTPNIVINGNGSSTGPSFSYEWTTFDGNIISGENTLNPTVNQGGTYTLVVTNGDNGCTKTVSVTIPEDANIPVANAGPDLELNCYNPTIQLNGTASTGPGITILWTANPGNIVSGANTPTPTVNQVGVYTLTVSNIGNGCVQTDEVEVTQNFSIPTAAIAPAGVLNCYDQTIDLDAGPSTQGPEIQFEWYTNNGSISSGANSANPTVSAPGTYNLIVTNTESGCTATASVTVTQNITPPIANAGLGFELDCQHPDGILNGSGSSQGSNFVYLWETFDGNIVSGETTLTPLVDEAGTYYLTVTNLANGCTAQNTTVVTVNQNLPVANAGPIMELNCANTTIMLDGTSSVNTNGVQITWVAISGNIVSGANTLTPTVNQTGIYQLTLVNNQNGCTSTDEVFVDDNIIYPDAIIQAPSIINCAASSVQIDANSSSNGPEFYYQWTTPNGNIVYGDNSPYPEVDQPGIYNLVITNQDNFCTATATVTIGIDTMPPLAFAVANGQLTCEFPQTTLNGTGSSSGYQYFYQWTTSDGNILDGELTLSPTVNLPGTYTLTVYNIETGCENTANALVTTATQFPVANAGPLQTITCTNAQLALDGSGSSQGGQYAYVWSTQNGNIVSGANTLNPVVNMPGQYDLSIVNTINGCTATSSVNVNINTVLPTAVAAPAGLLSCTVTTLTLDGTGSSSGNSNFVYQWTTVNGSIVSGDTTLNPVVNAVGNYTLIVTNLANGCTASALTNVAADASLPVATAGPSDTLNCYVSQLALNGIGSSQGPEFTYQWSGPGIVSGGNTLTPTVNASGAYALLVSNTSNGCTANGVVQIIANTTPPIAEAGPTAIINCFNPTLSLSGVGSSTGPVYTYNWTTPNGNIISGANTLSPTIDQPGDYSLLVTNLNNGCINSDAVSINIDVAAPQAEAGPDGLITCTNATVTLSGTASQGGIFSYLWTTVNGNIASGDSTLNPIVDAQAPTPCWSPTTKMVVPVWMWLPWQKMPMCQMPLQQYRANSIASPVSSV
ncbi:MAG: choice-of-anchor L domain-containing protein [Lewinellaceae bacterium]|nr:choice-of-anchor L domain-containing protein [Lewinellaceae bacterium]